jgi:putative DNA primase/helicase
VTDTMEGNTPLPRNKTDELLITVSKSRGDLAKIKKEETTWLKLCEELSTYITDSLTTEQFQKLSIEEQHKRKNTGYIVGGRFQGRARKKTELIERTLLTFDIDRCSQETLDELLHPETALFSPLAPYEYHVYSTRNHTNEAPRIRVVVPLAKPIPPVQYKPLMRIISSQIDKTMETVDPVSFRLTQVMYNPSKNKDAPFITFRNATGKLLSAKEHFKTWPNDWKIYTLLPSSPREPRLREELDKAPDPRTKPGIIGAFCRLYDIHTAIEKFLPDVYAPGSEEGRYSYLPGHTRDGAVVYDGGVFLYSHHGTDPCAGRLVNSLDLVRIHKFGHLDTVDAIDEAEDQISKLPSQKAMLQFVRQDEAVVREAAGDYYDEDAILADMLPDEETEEEEEVVSEPAAAAAVVKEEDDDKWKDDLERYETSGKYLPSLNNIVAIIENDRRTKGCLGFNDFNGRAVLRRNLRSKKMRLTKLYDTFNGDSLPENLDVTIRVLLETPPKFGGYGLTVKDRDLKDAIKFITHRHHFNPVADYLRSVKWDGIPRVRKLFASYFGAADTPLNEVFSFNFCVAAVQRAFEPGCKFDHVVILKGPQGIRKSGGLRALVPSHRLFGELTADLNKDEKVIEQIQGKWIIEIPELASFSNAKVGRLKVLFSAQEGSTRLAYRRDAAQYARRNVFAGTSNEEVFLKDDTGNRRFWPLPLEGTTVDTDAIERDRDQIWAEAYIEYRMLRLETDNPVLPLGVPKKFHQEVVSIQEEHTERPYERLAAQIAEWLDTPVPKEQTALGWRATDEDAVYTGEMAVRQKTCLRDVAELALGRMNFDPRGDKDIVAALRSLPNWRLGGLRQRVGGHRQSIYRRKHDNG